ncbi:4-alpha-glucanotransferase [Cellulomonas taurus]|uniref:4-alpha-glucanotransferase n=1 Tax=Cellulomonas taurus TaxID=2729175 RepID=UPI001FE7D2C9|nr:4-alpha-glucanotransferase [Cellulomonas taurus]
MEHPADLADPSDLTPLHALARAHGVDTAFDTFGGGRAEASPDTLVAVLAALGVDARTPERIATALQEVEDEPWRRVLPPVVVHRGGSAGDLPVHVDDGDPVTVRVELETGGTIDLAQSDHWVEPRTVDGRRVGRATFLLPDDLPLGWHTLRSTGPSADAATPLAVVPDRLELPEQVAAHPRWGLMVQLYSVRSRESWGLGDLRDLADLAWLTGTEGADFLLINPLHAAEPVPPLTPSPYLPTSRRFVNPLFLRVEDVHEVGYLSAADRALVEWAAEPALALNGDDGPIDRDTVWAAKRQALEVLFAVPRTPARETAFAEFRRREGQGLEDFALWCALVERDGPGPWSEDLRGPQAPGARRARTELAERIAFYCWLQWLADQQLDTAQRAATEAGMAIGVMHDLAVGVHPGGADAWALGGVLAGAASVGAPPDMYNQQGQDWSQPPWHPAELARVGYRPYRELLRTVFRHAGAVRIDHIMGLFRLWWIPRGQAPGTGTYVRYDVEAMVGILLLEAHRAGAVVIGEDLGVVEPGVRELLADRGVLGTSVLWFEKDAEGRPLRPDTYRRLALSTVTTHDLPPTAGYLAEEHVALRERLGLLAEPVPVVRAQARAEREAVLAALREQGLIGADPSEREVVEALHRYVRRTPSVLVGVSLADAVGERRAQNQPGTDTEYPNWKVPLADGAGRLVPLEEIVGHPRFRSLLAALRTR